MEYKLPKHWVEVQLIELLEVFENGSRPKGGVQGILEGVPSLGGEHLNDNRGFKFHKIKYIPKNYAENLNRGLIKKNDILIVKDGATTGKASFVSEKFPFKEAFVNEHVFICRPFSLLNSKYIYYFIYSDKGKNRILDNFTGTAQGGINRKFASNTLIPLPPLKEQQRIAKKLDDLFEQLDDVKKRLNHIPTLLKNFRQAVLNQAVTGKLTEEWRNGRGLEEWKETTVGEFMIEVKEKMNPQESKITNYIGLEHLLKDGGVIEKSTSEKLKSSKTVFKTGDVLYGKLRPYLNKHDIVEFDGVCSTDILVYRNEFKPSAHFFNYYLGTQNFISKANAESKGINLPRVSSKVINQFKINVPQKDEQTEIVKRVENLFSKTDQIQKRYEVLAKSIENLPQAILQKAFKGELVEQLPTDGDAAELLEEIKKLKEETSSKKKSTRINKKKRNKKKLTKTKNDQIKISF